MNRERMIHILRFFLLLIIQVLIFNNIYLGGYINPYVYILFILMLPFEISGIALLFLSFLMGLSVDLFIGSIGIHAAASTLIAFMRPRLLKGLLPKRDKDSNVKPGIAYMGFFGFLFYAMILIFVHHLVLFYLEAFGFDHFWQTLGRVILSTLVSTLLTLILHLLFGRLKD